jgi:anti-sigma B factor antagonist
MDTLTIPDLEDVLRSVDQSIVLDLSDVDYINSAGLGLLLGTHQRLTSNGHALTIANVTDYVRELLQITGLDRMLTLKS